MVIKRFFSTTTYLQTLSELSDVILTVLQLLDVFLLKGRLKVRDAKVILETNKELWRRLLKYRAAVHVQPTTQGYVR